MWIVDKHLNFHIFHNHDVQGPFSYIFFTIFNLMKCLFSNKTSLFFRRGCIDFLKVESASCCKLQRVKAEAYKESGTSRHLFVNVFS